MESEDRRWQVGIGVALAGGEWPLGWIVTINHTFQVLICVWCLATALLAFLRWDPKIPFLGFLDQKTPSKSAGEGTTPLPETIKDRFLIDIAEYISYANGFLAKHKGENIPISAEFKSWCDQATSFVRETENPHHPITFPCQNASDVLDALCQDKKILEQFRSGVEHEWLHLNPDLTEVKVHHFRFKDQFALIEAANGYARFMNPTDHPKGESK